jgi:hypothetical protein
VRGSVLLDGRVFDPDTHFFNIVGNSNEFERRNAVLTEAWAMLLNVIGSVPGECRSGMRSVEIGPG